MKRAASQGFTLVELMIVVAIIAILTILAIPNFVEWMQNSKTRTTADSIQNGLRYAQSQAITLNRQTTFAATASGWTVDYIANSAAASEDTQPHPLQVSPAGLFDNTAIAPGAGDPAVIAFSSLGRTLGGATAAGPFAVLAANASFTVSNPKGTRSLKVFVTPAGKVNMCDPGKTYNISTAPDGCP